jgi:hypothetical protein
MAEFARRFRGRVDDDVLQAMKELFKVATDEDAANDDAMVLLGGAEALDVETSLDASAASCSV